MHRQYLITLSRKFLDGEASESETRLLFDWYESFDDNSEEVILMESLEEPEAMRERMRRRIQAFVDSLPVAEAQVKPKGRSKLLLMGWKAVAVAVLLLAVPLTFLIVSRTHGRSPKFVEILVPRQKVEKIVLPDSSIVWLNADSKIRFAEDFNGPTREIYLEGEGFFDVRHDPAKPFIVRAGATVTRDIGTAFNIKAYPNQKNIYVTVSRGAVEVRDDHQHVAELMPNQQALFVKKSQQLVQKAVKAPEIKSWTAGAIVFDGETFEDIAVALNRRFNVNIHFANEQLRNCTFIASFDDNVSLRSVIDMLCRINNSKYTISDDHTDIMVTGKGCQ